MNYGFAPFSNDGTVCVWFSADSISTGTLIGKGNLGGDFDLFFNSNVLTGRSRIGGVTGT